MHISPVANLDLLPECVHTYVCMLIISMQLLLVCAPMRIWIIEVLLSYDRLVQVVHMAELLTFRWSL